MTRLKPVVYSLEVKQLINIETVNFTRPYLRVNCPNVKGYGYSNLEERRQGKVLTSVLVDMSQSVLVTHSGCDVKPTVTFPDAQDCRCILAGTDFSVQWDRRLSWP